MSLRRARKIRQVESSPLLEVARWFVEKRAALGLTQTEMAIRLEVAQSTVSDLERGDTGVRLSTLTAAIHRLGGVLTVKPRRIRIDRAKVYQETEDSQNSDQAED